MAGRGTRETFVTVRTEGALLPVEILQRIVDGDPDLEGLTPEDYHLSKNERLNEVINRAWHRCVQAWQGFRQSADSLPETDIGTTLTRERWLLILFQELGYGRLLTAKAQEIGGKSYPISHQWQNTPIHLISFRQELDRRSPGVAGAARFSPHSMLQEFLGRSEDHLWGIVSNGFLLRLLRDNVSLTRQSFVEFDLQSMMDGEIYSDFVLLFLLLHESRVEAERPDQCWLERWSREAQRRGTRALDQLRDGVEKAIADLGQGFIAHPANSGLRDSLRSGALTTLDFYQQLLRLVYRMIFLFVAEDRDLLLARNASQEVRRRYMVYYSLSRLRKLAGRRRGTRHGDLWIGLMTTFRCMRSGELALGIPALNGYLFSPEALTALDNCQISNDALLEALRHLCFTEENRILRTVDYRNLGTEELGSVYESLLELHPRININAHTFDLDVTAGSERKTTGSYYTPTSLILCLLDSALEPVVQRALKDGDPENALLGLKIVDPATGSGHFLIAASHRIAKHLAAVRTGELEPAPADRRKALRDVVSHCIYGVDINPLAVELCKVALWLETLDPGRPLGFLDHRIKCGNSLIGATAELLEKGIPDDAFKPVEGDDKSVASSIRRQNKEERKGQRSLFMIKEERAEWQATSKDYAALSVMPEDTVQQIEEKAKRYALLTKTVRYRHEKLLADLWTAAFFWPLTSATIDNVPTQATFKNLEENPDSLAGSKKKMLEDLSAMHRFFHWHLEYPDVFGSNGIGGFDCVLGNPPWERIKLQEVEFFATRNTEIANAPKKSARKRKIADLRATIATPADNALYQEFADAKRAAEATSIFVRESGLFPLTAMGDVNTYALFAEVALRLISPSGLGGIIVPTGIATDDSTKVYFSHLVEKQKIASLFSCYEIRNWFKGTDDRKSFCLLTLGICQEPIFSFDATTTEDFHVKERQFTLTSDDFDLLNPNTHTCPVFRSKMDAELTKNIYRHVPILIEDNKGAAGNPWGIQFMTMFHMSNDSQLFKTHKELFEDEATLCGAIWKRKNGDRWLPLYEAKMIHQFDHRWASYGSNEEVLHSVTNEDKRKITYEPLPRYWVSESDLKTRLKEWKGDWLIGCRSIALRSVERTIIADIIPSYGAGNSIVLITSKSGIPALDACALLANLCALVFDYVARLKIGGTNLNYFILKQLPILSPSVYSSADLDFISSRVLELCYTSEALQPFAMDLGYKGKPFIWDPERRVLLRAELDARFAQLYGLTRDELRYILDPADVCGENYPSETFRVLKENEIRNTGEYRTRRLILEAWDRVV